MESSKRHAVSDNDLRPFFLGFSTLIVSVRFGFTPRNFGGSVSSANIDGIGRLG